MLQPIIISTPGDGLKALHRPPPEDHEHEP
jgi:hypothetical protein